jgi:hypothetical protein
MTLVRNTILLAATVFGMLVALFLIVSGILLPFDIYISTLLVVMGAVMITACIACLDYLTSYRR